MGPLLSGYVMTALRSSASRPVSAGCALDLLSTNLPMLSRYAGPEVVALYLDRPEPEPEPEPEPVAVTVADHLPAADGCLAPGMLRTGKLETGRFPVPGTPAMPAGLR